MSRYLGLPLFMCVALLSACGAGRAPVAPGEIPRGSYTTAQDEEYGQQVLAELMHNYPLSQDDASINRVRDIVDKLADAAGANDTPWNVYVLRGPDVVNAAATRGHFVFVWTGMLDLVQNEGELAACLPMRWDMYSPTTPNQPPQKRPDRLWPLSGERRKPGRFRTGTLRSPCWACWNRGPRGDRGIHG